MKSICSGSPSAGGAGNISQQANRDLWALVLPVPPQPHYTTHQSHPPSVLWGPEVPGPALRSGMTALRIHLLTVKAERIWEVGSLQCRGSQEVSPVGSCERLRLGSVTEPALPGMVGRGKQELQPLPVTLKAKGTRHNVPSAEILSQGCHHQSPLGKSPLPHYQTTSCCRCQRCGSLSPAHHRTAVPGINPQQGWGQPGRPGQPHADNTHILLQEMRGSLGPGGGMKMQGLPSFPLGLTRD